MLCQTLLDESRQQADHFSVVSEGVGEGEKLQEEIGMSLIQEPSDGVVLDSSVGTSEREKAGGLSDGVVTTVSLGSTVEASAVGASNDLKTHFEARSSSEESEDELDLGLCGNTRLKRLKISGKSTLPYYKSSRHKK